MGRHHLDAALPARESSGGQRAGDGLRRRPQSVVAAVGETAAWEFDGTTWTQRALAIGPGIYSGIAAAWHASHQRIVGFGGGLLLARAAYSGETWLLGTNPLASAATLGTGCAGSAGVPQLTGSEAFVGSPGFVLDLLAARANAPGLFGLAAATQSVAIGACSFYLRDPLVLVPATTDAQGFASLPLVVPGDVALRGQALFAQAFVADPAAAPLGIAFSAGRRLVVGD
jgi:hypothetical protein